MSQISQHYGRTYRPRANDAFHPIRLVADDFAMVGALEIDTGDLICAEKRNLPPSLFDRE
jgi:hypothetical protein